MQKRSLILVFLFANCGAQPVRERVSEPVAVPTPTIVQKIRIIPRIPEIDRIERKDAIFAASDGVFDALSLTSADLPVWQKPLPADLSIEKLLDPKRKFTGSLSRGSVSSGLMVNSVKLEADGKHHEIIKRHRGRNTGFGTKELVDVLKHAAYSVSTKHGGAKLRIGNLSRKKGGDIPWSRSHNSGRDADLAFYVVDENGISVPLPQLTAFDENGSSARFPKLRFDLTRNWALVEALVMRNDVGVQWLFISLPLKKLLLVHARSAGASADAIARAEMVLHQPTDALPHDDHIHVRIACPPKDRIEGCLPSGPDWAWLPSQKPTMLARTHVLFEAIKSGTRAEEALAFLQTIRAPQRAEVALWLITSGQRPELHKAAIKLARSPFFWRPFALDRLRLILSNPDHVYLKDALFIARRAQSPNTYALLLHQAELNAVPAAKRAEYVAAMIHRTDPALIDHLVPMLGGESVLANQALTVLQHLTNHRGLADRIPKNAQKRAALIAEWVLFSNTSGRDRETWMSSGFKEQGVRDPGDIASLIKHMGNAPEFGAYNANRRLRELTQRWSPLEYSDVGWVQERWQKWFDKNGDRLIVAQFYPQVFTREYEDLFFPLAEIGGWKRTIDYVPPQESLLASNSQ